MNRFQMMGWSVAIGLLALTAGCDEDLGTEICDKTNCDTIAQNQKINDIKYDSAKRVCEETEHEYATLIDGASKCSVDGDCQILRGQCGMGIGGCYEVVNKGVDQGELDELGTLYEEQGCTSGVCSCAMLIAEAVCVDEQCQLEEEPTELENCDDGGELLCGMPIPHCQAGTIPAIIDNCYECVNPLTCEPAGWPGCESDDDCSEDEYCDQCATSSCQGCTDCVAGCLSLPVEPPVEFYCATNDDCMLYSNTCNGCECMVLPPEVALPVCETRELAYCLADPCDGQKAVCDLGGICVNLPIN